MTPFRALLGVVLFFVFLAARETTTISPAIGRDNAFTRPVGQPYIDVYGNEIDKAMGDYRVDPHGDLYERHAPDTAVLELGPPSV